MRRFCLALLLACKSEPPVPAKTTSQIAIENLEHQIGQLGMQVKMSPGSWARRGALIELFLMEAQFLGRVGALDRAVEWGVEGALGPDGMMVRARVLAALHRFAEAEVDLEAAAKLGAEPARIAAAKNALLVATGRAEEALAEREAEAKARPSFGTLSGVAAVYAELGRFDDAERSYLAALAQLSSPSPFPAAWIHFARGVMWAERAGDERRGAKCYEQALALLPEYVAASVHLAELSKTDGIPILERLGETEDPEVKSRLGALYLEAGRAEGRKLITEATARYEALLEKHPLAFADHAAEHFLGPGADPRRAYELAQKNLANRENARALALAIRAARAAGEDPCPLVRRARSKPRNGVELDGLLDGCE